VSLLALFATLEPGDATAAITAHLEPLPDEVQLDTLLQFFDDVAEQQDVVSEFVVLAWD
jgi:hypothetical protein